MSKNKDINLDDAVTYLIIQKLVTPVEKTDAFKMKLVDSQGAVIKTPESDDEKVALTMLDRFIFKIKRLLGSKLSQLNNFLYLHTADSSIYKKLYVRGNMESSNDIKRVKSGVDKLSEELNISQKDIISLYMHGIIEENIK